MSNYNNERLIELEAENATLRSRLAEAERDRVEIMRLWFQDASPGETRFASLYAMFNSLADSAATTPHDNNASVIVQDKLASTLNPHPMLSPTHRCTSCGALWRQCDDFSMNLRSPSCCDACNNAPVGPQIRPLYVAPSSADVERRPCTCPDGERPIPCPRVYALQDCRRAAALREDALRARLAEAERDAARIDFLSKRMTGASDSERYLPFRVYWGDSKDARKAIDAAMEGGE